MNIIEFDPSDEQMVKAIMRIPAFTPLGEGRLKEVMKMVTIRDYKKRETVIKQGEFDQCMFFLMKGKLSVQVDDVEVNIIKDANTVFGEMGVIDTLPRSATVQVRQPSRCLALDISFIDRLEGTSKLAVQAFFYKMFYEVLVQRLRETNGRIADLDMQKAVMENIDLE